MRLMLLWRKNTSAGCMSMRRSAVEFIELRKCMAASTAVPVAFGAGCRRTGVEPAICPMSSGHNGFSIHRLRRDAS